MMAMTPGISGRRKSQIQVRPSVTCCRTRSIGVLEYSPRELREMELKGVRVQLPCPVWMRS